VDYAEYPVSIAVLNEVPVLMPQGGGYQMKLPITKGDVVLLVFCDRSLDIWKSKGGEVDPIDLRQHHLSDAVAIPCLRDPAAAAPTVAVEIQSDGTVLVGPGADTGIVRFSDLKTFHDAETHVGNLGYPTGSPIVAMPANVGSSKGKVAP